MTEPSPQVFISYHRADREVAERLRAHLVRHGVKTWMDHYDIPAGAYWPDEIDRGLNQSHLVLGLLSPDAVESRNVKNEWDWALQNDKQLLLLMTCPCVVPHRYVSINFLDATTEAGLNAALEELLRVPGLRPAPAALTVPRTRYARSGEVNVAFQEFGQGDLDLVLVPGYVSHVEHFWKLPGMAAYLRRLASFARVLMFDKRGTGMSDRLGRISTLEERMDDIRAVMDAARSERAVIMGISEGVALSILFAATYPERTRSLILYGGRASYVRQPDYPWMRPLAEQRQEIDAAVETLYETWGTEESSRASVRMRAPAQEDDEALITWFAELQRVGASPGAEIARQRMNLEIDVRHVLPVVRVPTLVLNRVDDRIVNIGEARYIAERIPGAMLPAIPGDAHLPWEGDQDALFAAIERFVAETEAAPAEEERETVLATVVHLASDDAMPDELLGASARYAERFRGRIVATTVRGIEAVFDGPARAVRYADAVSAAVPSAGGSVRAGIQTGEMAIADSGASGPPVEVARRLAELAKPGQLLTTSTVRDLVAGSGIRFERAAKNQSGKLADVAQVLVVERGSLG